MNIIIFIAKNLKLLLILAIFTSCNYSSNRKTEMVLYQKDGLSFNLPKYWEVEEDRPVNGVPNSRFISVTNKEPLSDDDFFVITVIDSGNTNAVTMNNIINQSRNSYSKRKIDFGLLKQPYEVTIATHKVLRADFETKIIAIRNKGSFTIANYENKTISIVNSGETKNVKENIAVVDSVIKTLKIN